MTDNPHASHGRRASGPGAVLPVLLAATALACGQARAAELPCSPEGELRGDPDRGALLHVRHCATCHGPDGRAESAFSRDVPAKDQSDPAYMQALTDEFLYLAICRGGEGVGRSFAMPAWGDVLSDQDLRDLVAFIRTFSGT